MMIIVVILILSLLGRGIRYKVRPINNSRRAIYHIDHGHPFAVVRIDGVVGAMYFVEWITDYAVLKDKGGTYITVHSSEIIAWARYNAQTNMVDKA